MLGKFILDNIIIGKMIYIKIQIVIAYAINQSISFLQIFRYLSRRKPKSGFYNPPPMLMRYGRQRAYNPDIYSTVDMPTSRTATLSQHTTQPASLAMSQQTIDSRTATSTML